MDLAENKRRLWKLDRETFDYSTLPVVLDAVFGPSYDEEVLRQAVQRWTAEVDFRRYLGYRIDQRNEPLDFYDPHEPYNVEVSVIEDFGPTPNMYAALSECPASYVTSWSKTPGVEPADLFGPADAIWNRLFPNGELERSRCLTWSLLSDRHRSHPLSLAKADPMAAEMLVPSKADRAKRLSSEVASRPSVEMALARIEEVSSRVLTFEALTGSVPR